MKIFYSDMITPGMSIMNGRHFCYLVILPENIQFPVKQTQNILVVIRISSNEYWSRTASFAGLCILVLIIHGRLL